jgi:hypothetical protein
MPKVEEKKKSTFKKTYGAAVPITYIRTEICVVDITSHVPA